VRPPHRVAAEHEEEATDRFTVSRLAEALAIGRAWSPCSPVLVALAETAKNDWAALAPTACSNAGQIERLFTSKRYQRLQGDARLYYLGWLVQQGHYGAFKEALEVYRFESGATLVDGLQLKLSFALESHARAKGRAPHSPIMDGVEQLSLQHPPMDGEERRSLQMT
jgi:hypothetical protein